MNNSWECCSNKKETTQYICIFCGTQITPNSSSNQPLVPCACDLSKGYQSIDNRVEKETFYNRHRKIWIGSTASKRIIFYFKKEYENFLNEKKIRKDQLIEIMKVKESEEYILQQKIFNDKIIFFQDMGINLSEYCIYNYDENTYDPLYNNVIEINKLYDVIIKYGEKIKTEVKEEIKRSILDSYSEVLNSIS